MLRFFLIFLAWQVSLFGLYMLGWVQQHLVLPWTALLARVCAHLVLWFDTTAAAAGKVLWNTVSGFGVSIEPGCNGIEACIVLFAAIMAYPASWRHKVIGIVAGFAAVAAGAITSSAMPGNNCCSAVTTSKWNVIAMMPP